MSVLIIFLSCGIISPPMVASNPGRSWFTLETDNFLIHFSSIGKLSEERSEFARYIAEIAEEVRTTVASQTGVVPRDKIHIVVADFYDTYNGWAIPFPYNTITIMPAPPHDFKTNDDNWLRTLILHEYAHIMQLEQRRGFLSGLSRIFGRVVLPNALLPTWLIEGYAVYNETRFSNSGRLRSAEWQGMIYQAVQDNKLLGIDRCDGYELQRYPGGLAPYLYGGMFCKFIAQKQGENVWEEFNWKNSGQVPFFENRLAKRMLGKNFKQLWREWQDSLISRTDSIKKKMGKDSANLFTSLTSDGYDKSAPCWSKNGNEIYYITRTGRERTAIKCLNLGTMESRVLHRGRVIGGVSVSADGRLLAFAQRLVKYTGEEQSDIFLLDLTTGKKKRLTVDERAWDPDFAPNDSLLIYVSNSSGQSNLMILNYLTGQRRQITETRNYAVYHRPRFSPGGRLVAVEVWRPGGYTDIEIIDLETGWTIPITSDRASDIFPAWSRTGKFLFFSSDRSGLFNLYAYGVESRQLYRCTDDLGGVFEPAVSPSNRKIALVRLGSDGYDLSLMALRPRDWVPAADFGDSFPEKEYSPASFQSQLYHYYPIGTLLPRFWLPWLSVAPDLEVGAFTLGWDVLQFHRYSVVGGYQARNQTPFLRFNYELLRYLPDFNLEGFISPWAQQSRLGVAIPIYGDDWYQQSGTGITVRRDTMMAACFDLFWGFDNSQIFRFNVAPVSGREIGILSDAQHRVILGRQNVVRVAGYWNEYIGNPPAAWSLKFKFALGSAFGDSARFSAFQMSNCSGLFSVRGFSDSFPVGSNIGVAGLEFRMPIYWLERGIGTLPIFFRNVNGALFLETGLVTNQRRIDFKNWRKGGGGEVRFDFMFARYVPFSLTVGAAIGLEQKLSYQVYLNFASELLASITGNKKSGGLIILRRLDI
ncbi:hypothetical protein HPY86_06585 [candidate division WOR-3 bacterium]|nr:hypothetical protein [candidate division WOR-3 bacterium]